MTYLPITVGSRSAITKRGTTFRPMDEHSKNVRNESSMGMVLKHPFG